MRDLLWISRSVLTSSGAATLYNGMYCSFCMYVYMYVCMNVYIMVVVKIISPSIPIGERDTAMKRSMAGKGMTRDGLKMEQQVFMVGIPLCMYASR